MFYEMSQEADMMKDIIRKHLKGTDKRGSLLLYVPLIFTVIIGLTLTYALSVSDGSAPAGYFSFLNRNSEHAKEATKQAILKWMKENSEMSDHILDKIYHAASNTGNRDLILAICLVESNFNPHVKSHKGAIGLMGIMPDVWLEELKAEGIIRERKDLYKISGNIAAGAYVLATYLSETNDLRKALIRYVGGASWYATRVFRAQKHIELVRNSEQYATLQPFRTEGM